MFYCSRLFIFFLLVAAGTLKSQSIPQVPSHHLSLAASDRQLLFNSINKTTAATTPPPSFNKIRFVAKAVTGCIVGLGVHFVGEYFSTFAHEHGHGLTAQATNNQVTSYEIELINNSNIFTPWIGACKLNRSSSNYTEIQDLLFSLGGPLSGLATTYVQCMAIESIYHLSQGNSIKQATKKGLKSPYTFFSDTANIAQAVCESVWGKDKKPLKEPTFSEIVKWWCMMFRSSRIVGEFLYGLTPLHLKDAYVAEGDGISIWKVLAGKNCPQYSANLAGLSAIPLMSAVVTGMVRAWNNTKQPPAPNHSKN